MKGDKFKVSVKISIMDIFLVFSVVALVTIISESDVVSVWPGIIFLVIIFGVFWLCVWYSWKINEAKSLETMK